MQPAACASIRGTVNAFTPEDLILNRSANGSVMQALIIFRFAEYGGFRIMLTHKDAKMMARSLRDALGNRNVVLSHSDCLEIVARQFGLADWNTLAAKLPAEEERHTRTHVLILRRRRQIHRVQGQKMCPHLRSAESRLQRRTMKRP